MISVENVTPTLFTPESVLLIFEVSDIRLSAILLDPVFPARSVAMTVRVFAPHTRFVRILDQLPVMRVAGIPFILTLATHPVSYTVPESVGVPLTTTLFT